MISSGHIPHGPYRATKLWNEVVRLFQAGIPTKKHRQLLKTYDDCFTANEAIEWLHALLKANGNFGPQVTRHQTIQLLKKFLKNHVFEDIQGQWGSEDFADNGQLYRFPVTESPFESIRQPLALLQANTNVPNNKDKIQPKIKKEKYKSTPNLTQIAPAIRLGRGDNGLVQSWKGASQDASVSVDQVGMELSPKETEVVWRKSFLTCLRRVLHLQNVSDVLPEKLLNVDWLRHNATKIAPSGVVHVSPEEELPCWILSAMKCLAGWPDSTDSGLPNYEGFEKDVFKAILEYFDAMPDCLVTVDLHDVITTMLVRCELLDEMCRGHTHTVAIEGDANVKPPVARGDESELDRIRKTLEQAQMRHENIAVRRRRSGRSKKLFTAAQPLTSGSVPDLCLRHAEEANNNGGDDRQLKRRQSAKERGAKNSSWIDRFQSIPALDVLDEEDSFCLQPKESNRRMSYCGDISANNNGIRASLPELRIREHGVGAGSESYVNLSFHQKPFGDFKKANSDEDDVIYSSVENLLLNMSHTMRKELELDLMADDENLPPSDPRDDVIPSPSYTGKEAIPSSFLQKKNKSGVKHRSSGYYDDEIVSASCEDLIDTESPPESERCDPYMEIMSRRTPPVSSDDGRRESAFEMYNRMNGAAGGYKSLPRFMKKLSPITVQRVYSVRAQEVKYRHRKPLANSDVINGVPQRRVRPKSDIIERREVPPPGTKPDPQAAHQIRSRITRLPYVSAGSTEHSFIGKAPSIKEVESKFQRLSRSYSSLHPQIPVRPSQLAPSPSSNSSDPTTPLLRHKGRPGALANQAQEEPQSPLSAALDLARKQRVAIGDAQTSTRPHSSEAFQLCLLLLPPPNRRKLHLLLRLLSKMLRNPNLITFDKHLSLRSLIIQKFRRCVIRPSSTSSVNDVSGKLSERVFCFMLDHAGLLMSVPEKLAAEVAAGAKTAQEAKKAPAPKPRKLTRQFTFCKQVTSDEYANHSQSTLRSALSELLQTIVDDRNVSNKEKKKRLKQFQKSYPDIYKAHYPNGGPKLPSDPPRKQALLTGAIQRLRNFRL